VHAWDFDEKQLTLATAGFERYAKTTRRATFLAEMEQVVPWRRLCRLIEPVYPKAGNGRPPRSVLADSFRHLDLVISNVQ
jgi:hypothetical protein